MTQAGQLKQVLIPVTGMSCLGCQNTVERALQEQPGVESATVDRAAKTASVRFDPEVTTVERLAAAIERAGYRTR